MAACPYGHFCIGHRAEALHISDVDFADARTRGEVNVPSNLTPPPDAVGQTAKCQQQKAVEGPTCY